MIQQLQLQVDSTTLAIIMMALYQTRTVATVATFSTVPDPARSRSRFTSSAPTRPAWAPELMLVRGVVMAEAVAAIKPSASVKRRRMGDGRGGG
jgi:hypothetical protein